MIRCRPCFAAGGVATDAETREVDPAPYRWGTFTLPTEIDTSPES
jgi:hypothetical protein